MIKDLRTKLTMTSILATSLVLVVAIVIIFFTSFSRIDTIRKDNMDRALAFNLQEGTDEEFGRNHAGVVLIVYDKGEIVKVCRGDNVDPTFVDKAFKEAEKIVNSSQDENNISVNLQYKKQVVDGDTVKIVFHDPTNYQSGFLPLVLFTIGVLIVGVLSHSLISMMLASSAIAPIEESWKKQRQFVADASHELKTPLSVIMANTEIIASHPDDTVQSQMKWIDNTLVEAKRMASLVQDLLFLAKSDDGMKVPMEQTDLTDCVATCVLISESIFYENKKTFASDIAPNIQIMGNVGQLTQLVTILLDNANKYALGEGNIQLNLSASGKYAVLTVSNDSSEVSKEQVAHLFDRFYTLDTSRNKNNGGNGLGLSIAERITQTHNGTICAEYKNGRMTFRVMLPLLRNKKTSKRQGS